ncbi:MAG: hypothetical protein GX224_00815 [Thermoplasmatales archaeon]|nr:hypothetical protein [Thermoplasmatales archaeon]
MAKVRISCRVNPTESPEKVSRAVTNVFPDSVPEVSDGMLTATAPGLDAFSRRIRELRILDATRSVMYGGRGDGKTVFHINKQVAYMGKISFCEADAVLGPIRVEVVDDDILGLIDAVAPRTVDGEEVTA